MLARAPRASNEIIRQFAVVAKALYSLSLEYRRPRPRARADSQTVRFHDAGKVVKTHPRVRPARRSSTKPTPRPSRSPARSGTSPTG